MKERDELESANGDWGGSKNLDDCSVRRIASTGSNRAPLRQIRSPIVHLECPCFGDTLQTFPELVFFERPRAQ